MKRGEVWTVSGGADYASKPRPAVIVQDERFEATDSITICTFTTATRDAPLFRLPIEPSEVNGLAKVSRLMVDKVSTVPRTKLGRRLGRLKDDEIIRLNQSLIVFMGLGTTPRSATRTAKT